jgi:hypothetical protein
MADVPALSQTWTNGSGGGTPLSAARMTDIVTAVNNAIAAINDAVTALAGKQTTIPVYATKTLAQAAVANDSLPDGGYCTIVDPTS